MRCRGLSVRLLFFDDCGLKVQPHGALAAVERDLDVVREPGLKSHVHHGCHAAVSSIRGAGNASYVSSFIAHATDHNGGRRNLTRAHCVGIFDARSVRKEA